MRQLCYVITFELISFGFHENLLENCKKQRQINYNNYSIDQINATNIWIQCQRIRRFGFNVKRIRRPVQQILVDERRSARNWNDHVSTTHSNSNIFLLFCLSIYKSKICIRCGILSRRNDRVRPISIQIKRTLTLISFIFLKNLS